jgi:hypothetical protein
MIALRAVGSVFAGVTAARFVHGVAERSIPVASALTVGATVFLVASFSHPLPISLVFFLVGLSSGVMTLYFQLLVSDLSSIEIRGSALALAGLGWSLSHLTTPLMMGVFVDAFGIATAFYLLGGIATSWGLLLAPMHRWAFRMGKPR